MICIFCTYSHFNFQIIVVIINFPFCAILLYQPVNVFNSSCQSEHYNLNWWMFFIHNWNKSISSRVSDFFIDFCWKIIWDCQLQSSAYKAYILSTVLIEIILDTPSLGSVGKQCCSKFDTERVPTLSSASMCSKYQLTHRMVEQFESQHFCSFALNFISNQSGRFSRNPLWTNSLATNWAKEIPKLHLEMHRNSLGTSWHGGLSK